MIYFFNTFNKSLLNYKFCLEFYSSVYLFVPKFANILFSYCAFFIAEQILIYSRFQSLLNTRGRGHLPEHQNVLPLEDLRFYTY